jgi:putative FmdB family regulatory protein
LVLIIAPYNHNIKPLTNKKTVKLRKAVPIYEYKCDDCGKITELLESSGNKGERKCGHCGSGKLKKQFSVFSAQVKEGQSKKCFGCSDNSCPHSRR